MNEERIYVGRAVVDGQIRFSSVSQIKLFDPVSEGCHRKWAFPYIFGKRLQKTKSQTSGSADGKKLEHYLKTGENVLTPVLQPAQKFFPLPGKDLEVEEPLGPDFPAAVFLREALLKPEHANRKDIADEMQRLAGLTIRGIPLDGAADWRHRRGEYIDEEGLLRKEHPNTDVVEVSDLKTTSRIWSRKVLKGKSAGQTLVGYAKTSAQVCSDAQMVGYGKHAVDRYPGVTHVRLSHVYAQTSTKGAAKRTGLISVEEVLRRFSRLEDVVDEMTQVATAARIEDVKPTTTSCDSYTHIAPDGSTQKGCGHRYYCPLSQSVVVQNMLGQYKESAMSLFDQLSPDAIPAAAPSAPVAPASVVDERAAIEAEKLRLLAEDQGPKRTGCGAAGCGVNAAPGWVKSPTDTSGFFFCKACSGQGRTVSVAPITPASPMAVTPPDAPPPAPLLTAAAPLPPAALAEITDPVLRKTVEQHAVQHKMMEDQQAVAEAAAKQAAGTNVWCAKSNQQIVVTIEIAMARNKYVCECGKAITLKPEKLGDGSHIATIKKHKPANRVEVATVSPPPPPVAVAGVDDEEEEISVVVPPPPPAPSANGVNGHAFVATSRSSIINGVEANIPRTGDFKADALALLQSIDRSLRELCSRASAGA